MMHLVDEPGTRRMFVSTCAASCTPSAMTVRPSRCIWTCAIRSGASVRSRKAASAGSRVLRCIRTSIAAAHRGTAGSTLSPTSTITNVPADFKPGGGSAHARHGVARVDREESRVGHLRRQRAARVDCASRSRSRTTTADTSRSIRLPHSATPISGCSTSESPTAAAVAIRSISRRISTPASERSSASIRQETTARTANTAFPASNPFANDNKTDTLGEIYAYGVRNAQRLFWDPKTGRMYMPTLARISSKRSVRSKPAPT